MGDNANKILSFLKHSSSGCCDDCLSQNLGIYPRQQVNSICRRLQGQGKIKRHKNVCSQCLGYKITNVYVENELLNNYTQIVKEHFDYKIPKKRNNLKIPVENRLKLLTQSRATFYSYVKYFNKRRIFTGPSVYFHKKVIGLIRDTKDYGNLISSERFLEYVYATLASWGMHRMGQGAKLVEFDEFKKSVFDYRDILEKLSVFKISKLPDEWLVEVKSDLINLMRNFSIMKTSKKLVGNSKTLHHFLPDLMPIIDRAYTLRFFYNDTGYDNSNYLAKFNYIFDQFRSICKELNLGEDDYKNKGEFSTSIPKLIDNAIIGFILKHR
ncbi:MAG: hypothetical protein ACTSQY_11425 [Candidatus Odinarchaeia archaeon]